MIKAIAIRDAIYLLALHGVCQKGLVCQFVKARGMRNA